MKRRTLWAALATIFAVAGIVVVPAALADGTEALGPPSVAVASGTGVVVAGLGMEAYPNLPNSFNVNVPAGATVKQVLLYWEGHFSAPYAAAGDSSITINGNPVTGTLIGGPTAFFGTGSGGTETFSTYRADITGLNLVAAGSSTLTVTDMLFQSNFPSGGFLTEGNDGVGVMVVYDDGSASTLVGIRDGSDLAYKFFAPPLDTTVPQTFTFAAAPTDRSATLSTLAASVKGIDNARHRGSILRLTFDVGAPVDIVNPWQSNQGFEFDALNSAITIPAGASSLTVQALSEGPFDGGNQPASFAWVGAALSIQTPATGALEGCVYSNVPVGSPLGLLNGAGGQFTLFAINGGELLLNQATVTGDVALGPNATATALQKTTISGKYYHHQASPPSYSVKDTFIGGGFQQMNLTAAQTAANQKSAQFAAMAVPAGNVLGNVTTSLSLSRPAGTTNVFSISNLDYKEQVLTLNGAANTFYIFNVSGGFKFAASQIVLTGGMGPKNVIFNFPTAGDIIEVHKAESVFNGIILAPQREVRYSDPGIFNGSIIAKIVKVYSGAKIYYSACIPATVTATNQANPADTHSVTGDSSGYSITGLTAGATYRLTLTVPAGYSANDAFVGTFGGTKTNATTVSNIAIPAIGGTGTGYDFKVTKN